MNSSETSLEALARAAQGGDRAALETLVKRIRHDIYRLALRMVTRPAEAEDATQEVLIRLVTRLSTYQGEAKLMTWAYRVAVNHLIDRRRSCAERAELTFDGFAEDLADGLASPPDDPEREVLAQEVKLGCTLALLSCLDREHRIAYVLAEVFGLASADAAYVCEVSEPTYRKRLSRARERVHGFLEAHCGLVAPERAACHCELRIRAAQARGRVDPAQLVYARHAAERATQELETLHDAAALMRGHPGYLAPERITDGIVQLLRSGRFDVLGE